MPFCRPALLLSIPAPGWLLGKEVAAWERRRHGCPHALPVGWRSVHQSLVGWVVSQLGGWLAGWFLRGLADRVLCCPALPALLSVADWFKALAGTH